VTARLVSVGFRVRDADAAARFYREAFDADLTARGDVRVGPTQVAELGFVVDDLAAAHARAVAAGARVEREPHDGSAAYLDPDGNVVTLAERPRAVRGAGVDLAGGALAVVVLEGSRVVDAFRCDTFADALLVDAEVVGVDVPIGLPEAGARRADEEARRFVGERASSVFPTPIRAVLEAPTYADARRVATELTGKSVSAQSYALGRRILEVDEYAHRDTRVIEVHPEVSFHELAHRPLTSKHRLEGLVERRALLEDAGLDVPATAPRIAEPDLLDATIVAWTAQRYARGDALPLPADHTERIGAIWR
jgi:predicted RNase H-like nuclease/catechol 2,3-dioxygenase-like lactoylglutathione lyase family enzyme